MAPLVRRAAKPKTLYVITYRSSERLAHKLPHDAQPPAVCSGLILSSQEVYNVGHFGVSEDLPSYCCHKLSLSDA